MSLAVSAPWIAQLTDRKMSDSTQEVSTAHVQALSDHCLVPTVGTWSLASFPLNSPHDFHIFIRLKIMKITYTTLDTSFTLVFAHLDL